MRRVLPFLIIAIVLLVAVGAGVLLFRYRMEPEPAPPSPTAKPAPSVTAVPSPAISPTTAPLPSPSAIESPTPGPTSTAPSPAKTIVFNYGRPGAEPLHIRGDPGAPVVLEEFGDFECMPCSRLFPVLEKLEHDFPQQLVVVFREHPLKMHRFALDAARAAEAAGLQGKFWEMHDTLYRNRATWVPATYVRPYLNEYAAQIGLDVERFKNDIDGYEVAGRIVADQERGDSLGVDRTPIIYINGEKIPVTELNENGLRAAIEKSLAAKSR